MSVEVSNQLVAPPIVSFAIPLQNPPAEAESRVEWRSYSGWFALAWMLDLGWLIYLAHGGVGTFEGPLPRAYLAKLAIGLLVAGVLTFSLPLALVDDSSHSTRSWWIAWLWPPVLLGMLATDAIVTGYGLMPLLAVLKHH